MADNTQLNLGVGGDTIATEEDGSNVKHQLVKVEWGADDQFFKASNTHPIPVKQADLLIARGLVSNVSAVNKFGFNNDIDTGSVPEDIWQQGGLYQHPTAARQHDVVSTDAADTNSAGTGARKVFIEGLDASFAYASETVNLNGTTAVTTVNSYTRINRAYVTEAGSGKTNAGGISLTAQTDATVSALIAAGLGQTELAIYSVPTGRNFYINSVFADAYRLSAPSNAQIFCQVMQRQGIDTSTPVERVVFTAGLSLEGSSNRERHYQPPKKILGPCDIFWRVTYVSDSNIGVSAGFDGEEVIE